MADQPNPHYKNFTDAEQATYCEYARHRELTDWSGWTDGLESNKREARDWLVKQRKNIWRAAQPKADGGDGKGWGANNRDSRYKGLHDDWLNKSVCHKLCQLPTNGGTPTEKVYISLREAYWRIDSQTDGQKQRRQGNADWLTARRKQVWHLGEDEGWDQAERELRYDNLCVATKTGQPYDEWAKGHDTETGAAKDTGGGSRSDCKRWLEKHLGVSEDPPNSNRGHEQPSKWQQRVYGDDGVPWCACFAGCSAWDNGVTGSVTAGVYNNTQLAKQGQGVYRGYTTDHTKVRAGDHAFIGSDHTGVIYDADTLTTIEGNTSPGSEGSQYNGGCVAKRNRGPGYWTGYGLVDFPE